METGLVLTIPAADPVVGDWRRQFDPVAAVGMPAHVTLVYPFRDSDRLEDADRGRLTALFAGCAPFELSFSSARQFAGENVLWLAPEPPEPVDSLIAAIVAAFPEHPPYGGRFETVIPHLTVAQSPGAPLAEIEAALAGVLIRQRIEAVSLFGLTGEGWRELERFALEGRG